jgi:tryptophan 2,3-dioxygenase
VLRASRAHAWQDAPPGGPEGRHTCGLEARNTSAGGNIMDLKTSFGDGSSDYEKYIRTQELYKLQKTPDQWENEEELLFQVVHQAMELWLKVCIQHLEQTIVWMNEGNLHESTRFLLRTSEVLDWLAESLKFPRSMAPWDYHKIRMVLGKGSGQESPTYKELHNVVPRVGEAFDALIKARGVTLDEIHAERMKRQELYDLMWALTQFDQELMNWKYRHYHVVRRIIGDGVKSLKGVPAKALERTTLEPAFPDLWQVINRTTNEYNARHRPEGGAYQ